MRQGGGVGVGVVLMWLLAFPDPLCRGSDFRDFFIGGGVRWFGCRGRRPSGNSNCGGGSGGRFEPSIILARCLARIPPPADDPTDPPTIGDPDPARPRFLAAAPLNAGVEWMGCVGRIGGVGPISD